MRVSVTVVDPRHDSRRDVMIDAADETPMAEVLAGLQREALGVVTVPGVPSLAARRAADAGESPLYLDGRVLDTGGTLADSGLREGSLVVVGDAAASSREEPSGTVELRVVSGRGAGAVHRLDVGEATIGADPACVVRLPDDRIPPVAARCRSPPTARSRSRRTTAPPRPWPQRPTTTTPWRSTARR